MSSKQSLAKMDSDIEKYRVWSAELPGSQQPGRTFWCPLPPWQVSARQRQSSRLHEIESPFLFLRQLAASTSRDLEVPALFCSWNTTDSCNDCLLFHYHGSVDYPGLAWPDCSQSGRKVTLRLSAQVVRQKTAEKMTDRKYAGWLSDNRWHA